MFRPAIALDRKVFKLPAHHQLCGDLGHGNSGGFADERHGARRAGIHLQHIDDPILHRILNVHQSDDIQGEGQSSRVDKKRVQLLCIHCIRREDARAVARVDPCLFDVLHYPANKHILAVTSRINIKFKRIFQESINQHGMIFRDMDCFPHVLGQSTVVIADLHCAAAKHV